MENAKFLKFVASGKYLLLMLCFSLYLSGKMLFESYVNFEENLDIIDVSDRKAFIASLTKYVINLFMFLAVFATAIVLVTYKIMKKYTKIFE